MVRVQSKPFVFFAFSVGARNRPDPLDADYSLLTEFQVLATADSLYATYVGD